MTPKGHFEINWPKFLTKPLRVLEDKVKIKNKQTNKKTIKKKMLLTFTDIKVHM